ncbi:DNA-binding protein [Capnocytophaga stomatis]|uniref:DNA-binding protein n=1 Tax=Capnocytophaga stomatis TaxID=1848904 RepID=A0A250FYS6_9FLAO|nr:DNA-binding protein [Capnocytophaga stomatis]ATA89238.1 DNA-binding protein [Capnocytophaga stomatis]
MNHDFTKSSIDRQNILNNPKYVENIQQYLGVSGMFYNEEYRFTIAQTADFYGVSQKTIRRYIDNHQQELEHNGYCVLKGQKLKEFKELFGYLIYGDIEEDFTMDIDVHRETQNTDKQKLKSIKNLGVFNFRSFLNIAMLLTESEKAKQIRSVILDIVIDTLNEKLGGNTKYINQRDSDYIIAILEEPRYRKEFTSALNRYLEMGNAKYSIYTDAIYQAIFLENAKEYKQILDLIDTENARETMYAEVLRLIASFEVGIADEMKKIFEEKGRKLFPQELDKLINNFASQRFWIPQLEDVRTKMASRDYGFRKVVHQRLENYIQSVPKGDYDRFLGENSKTLQEQIQENIDVFLRLREK